MRHLLDPERVKLADAQVPPGLPAALYVALQQAIRDSFVSGFRVVMVICSGLAVAAAIAAGMLISGKKPGDENEKAAG